MKVEQENKIYAKDFKCSYISKDSKPCKEQAIAFYPVWDMDQENPPRPYCQEHLGTMRFYLYLALNDQKEYERVMKAHERARKRNAKKKSS
jgi:hypothetical protein